MKHQFKATSLSVLFLVFGILMNSEASAKKIYLNKTPDNGIWINGSSFAYAPGDTLVLRASAGPYSYLDMTGFNGTAAKPLYIINEGGQVTMEVMRFKHCNYIKVLGNGASNQYGFYMTSSNINAPAFGISGRSSNFEIAYADVNYHGYGFWVKEEGDCDPALQHPNWTLDNFVLHDNRVRNTHYAAFYLGSTDPSGTRPYTCNGATTYPLPLRLGNVKVYNNIIDLTGRGGIQMSSTQFGTNEIYNNTITNIGTLLDGQQGNGIVLGGYTSANIYNNNINYTLASGIYSLGAGLIKIENNTVNNSGNLNGNSTVFASNVFIDTRPTSPELFTTFEIKNNTLGAHTGEKHIRVHKSYNTFTTNNIICGNTAISGSIATHVDMGITWTACAPNIVPVVSAGPNLNIVLPSNGANMYGSASDVDGNIASYKWSKVSGPASSNIAYPGSPQTMINDLVEGTYVFRLTVVDNQNATSFADASVIVSTTPVTNPLPAPPPPTAPSTTSIKIEAENYASMSGIQTEPTSDAGGGHNVGWQDNNDWMNYAVNISAAGTYTVNFRVASYFTGAQFQLRNASGTSLATVTVPNTGGFQTWTTISAQATLPAGQQTLRLFTSNANGGWNINWWEIAGVTTSTTTNLAPVANAGTNQTITLPTNSVTLTGSGTDADGTIASYAWTKVSGPSGETIASPAQAQTNITGLLQGTYVFRLTVKDNAGASGTADVTITVNAAPPTSTPTITSIKIEAENYASMSGIQTELTSDAGGGYNVGWQDNNDWMNYAVNISSAGTYLVNFRVASYFTGAQFQLRNASGTSLSTVTVPNTGSFQTWTTISVQVTLPAGQQTLRLFTTNANGGWNINWWEIVPQAVSTMSVNTGNGSETEAPLVSGSIGIYPNPVDDKFMLQVNNELTGSLKVQIVNLQGTVVKQFNLNKTNTGTSQFYLTIGELPTGQYILNATMKDWTLSQQLIRQ